jgi:hypothetical protein
VSLNKITEKRNKEKAEMEKGIDMKLNFIK